MHIHRHCMICNPWDLKRPMRNTTTKEEGNKQLWTLWRGRKNRRGRGSTRKEEYKRASLGQFKNERQEQLAVEVDRLNDKMHIPTKQTDVPLGYLRKVQHIHFWKHHSMITWTSKMCHYSIWTISFFSVIISNLFHFCDNGHNPYRFSTLNYTVVIICTHTQLLELSISRFSKL